MTTEKIEEGFDVFLKDGKKAFGAVREVKHDGIVINVENAGDFFVPALAIEDAHSEKVILHLARLEPKLQRAIAHAHQAEDPKI